MAAFLNALGLVILVLLITITGTVALVMRSLARANRVSPGRRSPAPLSWLASPGGAARLHRRLRRAVASADLSVGSFGGNAVTLQDVRAELVARSVAADEWLVAVNGLHPLVRRPRLHELAAEVRDIEASAGRLHRLCADWRRHLDLSTNASVMAPPSLHERMDAFEAAMRELPVAHQEPLLQPNLTAARATARLPR